MYSFTFRRRVSAMGPDGLREWIRTEETADWRPDESAVVVSDMWDRHWSAGAAFRCKRLAERVNDAVIRARRGGMLIVHAPSSTMPFYEGTPARARFWEAPPVDNEPVARNIVNFALPIDDSDGGSDTDDAYPPNTAVWTRQTDSITIDQDRDIVCGDEGEQLYACFRARGIRHMLIMGVHTNMCVLNRSFGIKRMLSRGMDVALVRDLTDAMYNPQKPPYVSHDEGTRLVVEYIEKFYCPTIDSAQM